VSRRKPSSALGAVLALAYTACSKEPPLGEICNGSQDRTLSVVVVPGAGGIADGSILLAENGVRFFHVRGDCQYWVNKGEGSRYRTGSLGDMKTQLATDLFYGQWGAKGLTRGWGPDPGTFDASPTRFSDGHDRLSISCPCAVDVPSEIPAMSSAEQQWEERLSNAGAPVDGPIRIVVIDDPSRVFGLPEALWPLSWPLSSVAVSADDAFTLGPGERNVVISDPIEVSKVVSIWEEYLSGAHGPLVQGSAIPFRDVSVSGDAGVGDGGANPVGRLYLVLIRDTLPIEDEIGLIPAL